jgi:hypothetical protein
LQNLLAGTGSPGVSADFACFQSCFDLLLDWWLPANPATGKRKSVRRFVFTKREVQKKINDINHKLETESVTSV